MENKYKFILLGLFLLLFTGCMANNADVTILDLPQDSRGNVEVAIQDQFTEIIDLRMFQRLGDIVILQNTSIGDRYINISSPDSVPQVGQILCLKSDNSPAFFQPEILAVTPLGGTNYQIYMDMPLDYDFDTTDGCSIGNVNWAVDGSITPVRFLISPSNHPDDVSWDITRIMWYCEGDGTNTPGDPTPDYTAFFTMDSLTNGAYLRTVDGTTKNLFNFKNNGEAVARMYDFTIIQTPNRNGFYSAFARRTFNGADKNGVTIRLDAVTNDTIEWVVQDNLTEMSFCKAVVQGHIVE
jgi:hypothetical protein